MENTFAKTIEKVFAKGQENSGNPEKSRVPVLCAYRNIMSENEGLKWSLQN
jgi:hypothetical protein